MGLELSSSNGNGNPEPGPLKLWSKCLNGNSLPSDQLIFLGGPDSNEPLKHDEPGSLSLLFFPPPNPPLVAEGLNFVNPNWLKKIELCNRTSSILKSPSPSLRNSRIIKDFRRSRINKQGNRRDRSPNKNSQNRFTHPRKSCKFIIHRAHPQNGDCSSFTGANHTIFHTKSPKHYDRETLHDQTISPFQEKKILGNSIDLQPFGERESINEEKPKPMMFKFLI